MKIEQVIMALKKRVVKEFQQRSGFMSALGIWLVILGILGFVLLYNPF
jgi:hypothetical protein